MSQATIQKDLEGAGGWQNWKHLFRTINPCCRYLVLRNFEALPDSLEDADIDLLTDNFQRFASAANVFQKTNRPYKGTLNISGVRVPTDIRFLGDNYFDGQWQRTVLQRRELVNEVYVPAQDDFFLRCYITARFTKFRLSRNTLTFLVRCQRR